MEKVRSCMINIISKRELSNSVIYELDDNILRSNIISILKMFENGKHKFGECSCSTWDEDGHVMRPCFHSIDELEKLKEYPSPDMSFDVDYVNSDTGKYSYTISASTNNNIITFFIDNKNVDFPQFHELFKKISKNAIRLKIIKHYLLS